MKPRVVPQRAFNFEYIMWLFMRLSGLALYTLALIGIVNALLMGARTQTDMVTLLRWTYFPNSYHVANSNILDQTLWTTDIWAKMQVMIVFFGITHGFNGLRNVLEDYIGYTFWKPVLRFVLFGLWLAMLLVAYYVIYNV